MAVFLYVKTNIHIIESSAEQPDWALQSQDLNPTEHLQNELEHRSWAVSHHPTSAPDLTDALVFEKKSPRVLTYRLSADWKVAPSPY